MSKPQHNWVKEAPGKLNRIEASFSGKAFSPHRHDTYAIGITLDGIQTFDYRGHTRHSLPGQVVVLHPDEIHDGRAGNDGGFRYRTLYLHPQHVQEILDGMPLPFIKNGISTNNGLRRSVTNLLEDYDRPLSELEHDDFIYDLVQSLSTIGNAPAKPSAKSFKAALAAREYIDDSLDDAVTLQDLETATGRDRWALSRDFRAFYGTSPCRYLNFRRLESAKDMLQKGCSIADTAYACHFSDQSHFTRHFKKTFGITPDKWRTIVLSA